MSEAGERMAETALLVVDMQNGFCKPGGSFAVLGQRPATVDGCVRNVTAAVSGARESGVPVVFTRMVYRPGRPDESRHAKRSKGSVATVGGLAANSWDAAVIDELGCGEADLVVDKVRYDAFLWTSLDPLLRGMGVTSLVVCGVLTNFCVESTVRAAFMRDYDVTLLADCCTALTPRLHEIGVTVMRDCGFAEIAALDSGFTFPFQPLPALDGVVRP
jgi:ureidoacrylate peracid hydrolase